MDIIFSIIILLMSVVLHEVAHGYAAYGLGDPTAKYEGRLTLNPIKHLDLFGSIILPLLLALSHTGIIVGWAKPVPYNPYNLRNRRWGELFVASAGILTNLCLAIFFGLIIRFALPMGIIPISFFHILLLIVVINLVLAVFNLAPVPPLDGSKIFFAFLPERLTHVRLFIERFGFIFVLVFILFLWQFVSPLVSLLASLIIGVPV